MDADTINAYIPLTMPSEFARNGTVNANIPDDAGSGIVSYAQGFPPDFSNPRANNGKSISRADMNGLLHDISTFGFYFQYMGRNPWRQGVAYPVGARVYYGGKEYVCTVDGCTTTPGTDGDDWVSTEIVPYNPGPLTAAIMELSGAIEALIAGGGGGGGGASFQSVDYLQFARFTDDEPGFEDPTRNSSSVQGLYSGTTPVCEFPIAELLPTVWWTGAYNRKYVSQTDKVNFVGCKFSVDPSFLERPYDTKAYNNRVNFFRWSSNVGGNGGQLTGAGSVGVYRTQSGFTVGFVTGGSGDTSIGARKLVSEHTSNDEFIEIDEMPNVNAVFEVASIMGLDYYKIHDYEVGTDIERLTCRHASYFIPSGSTGIAAPPYYGNNLRKRNYVIVGSPYANHRDENTSLLHYIRLHEVFVGYMDKDASTSYITNKLSVEAQFRGNFIKTYRSVPSWNATESTWKWTTKLVNADGTDGEIAKTWYSEQLSDNLFTYPTQGAS